MKRVFLVLGPESSGGRLVARILGAGGCHVVIDSEPPFWPEPFGDLDPVAWHRSVPHRGLWLAGMPKIMMHCKGRTVHAVVVVRALECMARSQVLAGHVKTLEQAEENVGNAFTEIFACLSFYSLPFTVVPYESLVLHPEEAQAALLRSLGLHVPEERPSDRFLYIDDRNEKHYRRG